MRIETGLTVMRILCQLRSLDVQPKVANLVFERPDDVLGLLWFFDVAHRHVQHCEQAARAKLQRFGFRGQTVVRGRRLRTGDTGSDGLGGRYGLRNLNIPAW